MLWKVWIVSEPPPHCDAADSSSRPPPLPLIKRGTRGLPSQQSRQQQRARAMADSPMTKAGSRFKLEKKQGAMVSQQAHWE